MAEAAEFAIGAKASASDGVCGEVSRLIMDPVALTVTHLVIEPKHRRRVQADLFPCTLWIRRPARSGCAVASRNSTSSIPPRRPSWRRGSITGAATARLRRSRVTAAWAAIWGRSGMGIGMGVGHSTPVVVHDVVPLGETDVQRGESVHALDGEIGKVQGFVVDPGDNHVTHVLLQEGHLWGRKEVSIPISAVIGVDAGIRLNITKKQVEDLPPVD